MPPNPIEDYPYDDEEAMAAYLWPPHRQQPYESADYANYHHFDYDPEYEYLTDDVDPAAMASAAHSQQRRRRRRRRSNHSGDNTAATSAVHRNNNNDYHNNNNYNNNNNGSNLYGHNNSYSRYNHYNEPDQFVELDPPDGYYDGVDYAVGDEGDFVAGLAARIGHSRSPPVVATALPPTTATTTTSTTSATLSAATGAAAAAAAASSTPALFDGDVYTRFYDDGVSLPTLTNDWDGLGLVGERERELFEREFLGVDAHHGRGYYTHDVSGYPGDSGDERDDVDDDNNVDYWGGGEFGYPQPRRRSHTDTSDSFYGSQTHTNSRAAPRGGPRGHSHSNNGYYYTSAAAGLADDEPEYESRSDSSSHTSSSSLNSGEFDDYLESQGYYAYDGLSAVGHHYSLSGSASNVAAAANYLEQLDERIKELEIELEETQTLLHASLAGRLVLTEDDRGLLYINTTEGRPIERAVHGLELLSFPEHDSNGATRDGEVRENGGTDHSGRGVREASQSRSSGGGGGGYGEESTESSDVGCEDDTGHHNRSRSSRSSRSYSNGHSNGHSSGSGSTLGRAEPERVAGGSESADERGGLPPQPHLERQASSPSTTTAAEARESAVAASPSEHSSVQPVTAHTATTGSHVVDGNAEAYRPPRPRRSRSRQLFVHGSESETDDGISHSSYGSCENPPTSTLTPATVCAAHSSGVPASDVHDALDGSNNGQVDSGWSGRPGGHAANYARRLSAGSLSDDYAYAEAALLDLDSILASAEAVVAATATAANSQHSSVATRHDAGREVGVHGAPTVGRPCDPVAATVSDGDYEFEPSELLCGGQLSSGLHDDSLVTVRDVSRLQTDYSSLLASSVATQTALEQAQQAIESLSSQLATERAQREGLQELVSRMLGEWAALRDGGSDERSRSCNVEYETLVAEDTATTVPTAQSQSLARSSGTGRACEVEATTPSTTPASMGGDPCGDGAQAYTQGDASVCESEWEGGPGPAACVATVAVAALSLVAVSALCRTKR